MDGHRWAWVAVLVAGIGFAGAARADRFPAPEALPAVLDRLGGADLVVFDEVREGEATRVFLATRVRAEVGRVRAVLADPAAYRKAVPSFRRAEVVGTRGAAVLVAWELEVPLWNLEGKLWLRPADEGVDIELTEGDLAPGLFQVRLRVAGDGLVLSIDARANVREANWVSRRLAARSPLSESAMTAAAAWVLLRALVCEAESDPRRNPSGALAAPALNTLDGKPLGLASALLPAGLVSAAVRTRGDGRLERVEVAVPVPGGAQQVRHAIAEPQHWRAIPGWRRVKPLARASTSASASRAVSPTTWEVDSQMPFVDFDALWSVAPGPPFRAVAIGGDGRGAVLGWDVLETPARAGAMAVFSLHPRLEKAGYIPRKFIEAEPLLEQGLSLALAYVDAVAMVHALPRARAPQGEQ